MRKLHIAGLGVALAFGLGTTAAAQATPPQQQPPQTAQGQRQAGKSGRGEMSARRDSVLFNGITLSDKQKSQIKSIRAKYRPQFESLRSQAQTAAAAQGDVQHQRPDSATRAQMRSLMQKEQREERAVLTPDQQKTYEQNVAQARSQMKEHMKNQQGHTQSPPSKSGPR